MPLPKYGPYLLVLILFFCLSGYGQFSQKDLFEEANSLFEQGSYAEAMPGFAQLLSLEPGNPEYNYKYGATALYGDPSKREEAIKYLRFAIGKSETSPLAYYFLGRAYHLNYRFADAVEAYEKFAEKAGRREAEAFQIDLVTETARNGLNLLSQIKDVTVLDKKQSNRREFFRLYDLSDIGGKILVTPEQLLTSQDEKNNHRSLIHFRGEGTTVYFSSYGKDGNNGLDIYSAQVLPGGTFSDPKPVPGTINTSADEDFPYMHPDGKTFYFSSQGHSSMGGYDIFKAAYDRNSGTFASPVNMDFAVNTPDDDIFYIADSLNQLANFASGRSSEQGKLHVYSVSVDMVPVELTFVKGTFVNAVNPGQRTVKITVTDAATNKKVETQYSDPNTGNYLLSFPKSGRYKLHVEAPNSNRVHSGTVNVPQSEGVAAFEQEMELVMSAAVEKLIINNLFDQPYQGDIAALTREMLRKRAELEVNFDAASEPEPEAAPEPEVEEDDISLAYSKAGFGAGMTNEKVLADARSRNARFEKALQANLAKQNAAAAKAQDALNEARELMQQAEKLSAAAQPEVDGGKSEFEAAKARWDAKIAFDKAVIAADLETVLAQKTSELKARFEKDKTEVDALESALASGEYDAALAALKAENDRLKDFDKVADRVDMTAEVSASAKEARKEVERFMQRAVSMRNEIEKLIAERSTKRKQLENARGRSARDIREELDRLDVEIADSEAAVERSFDRAQKKESEAQKVEAQALLMKEIEKIDETSAQVQKPEATEFEAVTALMSDFSVDKNVVEAYLLRHPEALAAIGSGNELRAFAATTGVGSLSVDEAENLAYSQGRTTPSNPASGRETPAETAETAKKPVSEQEGTSRPEDLPAAEKKDSIAENTAPDINEDEQVEIAESETSPNETEVKSADPETMTDSLSEPDTSVEIADQIAEEQKALDAARDWIDIIDESVSDLKANGGEGDETESEQLAEYQKLKAEKEAEVVRRITQIENLRSSVTEDVRDADRVALADADLETLDASYISRLESKINEASSTDAFVTDISAVMPDYLDALEAIELSGESAPEMSAARIALNEKLISRIAREIDSDTPPVSADRLTEIRRIKALEIREDKKVALGETSFKPRTAEAVAYAEMIADASEPISENNEDAQETTLLSPALEESLRKPYSWDDVVPGYIDMMADDTEDITDPDDLEFRIQAHKTMLAKLKEDIDFYAVLASEGQSSRDPRIKQRYEQLLSERSMIADVLSADSKALESLRVAEATPADTPAKEEIAVSTESESIETQESKPVIADRRQVEHDAIAAETDRFIDRLSQDLEQASAEIANENKPAAVRLSELAALNASSAEQISAEIDSVMAKLDASTDDVERNLYQLQIQKMDALLADKLQEADRLSEESESAEIVMSPDVYSGSPAVDTTLLEQDLDLPENLAFDDLQIAAASSINVDDFAFRSLEANMNGAKMQAAETLAAQKRIEAQALMDAYAAAETSESRSEIYTELERVSREVKRSDIELNKSIKAANIAEVNFYSGGSEVMIAEVRKGQLEAGELAELDSISKEIAEVRGAIENNREIRDELDAYDTEAYSAMLNDEMKQISRLRVLNEELKTLVGEVQTRREAIALAVVDEPIESLETTEAESNEDTTAAAALTLSDPEPESVSISSESVGNSAVPEVESAEIAVNDPGVGVEVVAEIRDEKSQEDQHRPLPGKAYLTPALQDAADRITPEEREAIASSEPEFDVKLDFSTAETTDDRAELVEAALGLGPLGIDLLKDSPAHLAYLSTAVIADSLRKIENSTASLRERTYNSARERAAEADRLRAVAEEESDNSAMQNMIERADRIAAEAEESYKKAATAASRAEVVRLERRKQEDFLAETVKALDADQVAALNKMLKTDAYSVVTADLIGNETAEVAPPEATVESAPRPVASAPKPVVATEPDTNLSSGYTLATVEIIADKTDFSDVTETMFVVADRSLYNADKPIPVDPEMPGGLIFQVQVGAFRKEIPQDHFGEIVPVMGQKLDNGITRYRAGLFKSYGAAADAKDAIREMGYSDAFVVAYLDGERLTGAQARDIVSQARSALAQAETAEEKSLTSVESRDTQQVTAAASIDAEDATPAVPDYYNDPEAAEAVQVEVVRGLFYTVQVGVYSKPVALGNLYNLSDLNSELTASGLIRYTTGRYSNVAAASVGKSNAIDAGVTDAFVTAYYNGKRISLSEAEAVLEREGSDVLNITTGTVPAASESDEKAAETERSDAPTGDSTDVNTRYVIVLGQFGAQVPQTVADFFLENEDLNIRRIAGPAGQSMFVSPEFENRDEAELFLNSAKSAGVSSAILGTVINGEIKALETK